MKRFLFSSVFILLLGVQTASAEKEVRRFILLVDYIGSDYALAVQGGKVINAPEYQEMLAFSADALSLFASIPSPPDPQQPRKIQQDLQELQHMIENKGEPLDVATLARRIKNVTVALYRVETFPLKPPSFKKGRSLYTENCAVCHGADGSADTAKAKELNPPPTNFREPSVMEGLSPFKAFNVLSFGIPGTGMASFDALSEEHRWNLAFYLFSLRFSSGELEQGKTLWHQRLRKEELADLKTLSSLTDGELLRRLTNEEIPGEEERRYVLAYLRAELPSHITLDPLSHTLALLQRSYDLIKEGQQQEAYRALLEAYLEGFELAEPNLQATQPDRITEIEKIFADTRIALKEGGDLNRAAILLTQLRDEIAKVQTHLAEEKSSPSFAFLNSLIIIFREGMEAALIVAAILTFLWTTGQRRAVTYVHAGWIGAVGASLLTWLVAEFLIAIGGSQRELIEAITSLLAAAVLFYVSYWLLAKLEVRKWKAYIDAKVQTALSTGHLIALSGVSFLAVYREGFETVLFYQALLLHDPSAHASVFLGFTMGAAFLIAAIAAIFTIGIKIPLRYFFGITSGLLYVLATIFAGEGIYRLQQVDLLRRTPLDAVHFPILGIYPNAEGLLLQVSMLALFGTSLLWVFVITPKRVASSKSL